MTAEEFSSNDRCPSIFILQGGKLLLALVSNISGQTIPLQGKNSVWQIIKQVAHILMISTNQIGGGIIGELERWLIGEIRKMDRGIPSFIRK